MEVHDYNHGNVPQVIDYQHKNINDPPPHPGPPPLPPPADVIDYNHGQNGDGGFQQSNWNDAWQQQQQQQHVPTDGGYYQQHQWDPSYNQQWNSTDNYYNNDQTHANHYEQVKNQKHNQQHPSGFHNNADSRDGFGAEHSGNSTPGNFLKLHTVNELKKK